MRQRCVAVSQSEMTACLHLLAVLADHVTVMLLDHLGLPGTANRKGTVRAVAGGFLPKPFRLQPKSWGASPEEQMLLQMQGVFAEYERALIYERTRRGQLFAARQGRVNWGNPPYGYTYIHKGKPTTIAPSSG